MSADRMPISDGILSHPRPLPHNTDNRIHRNSNTLAVAIPRPGHTHQHGYAGSNHNPNTAHADSRGL